MKVIPQCCTIHQVAILKNVYISLSKYQTVRRSIEQGQERERSDTSECYNSCPPQVRMQVGGKDMDAYPRRGSESLKHDIELL
jgi:hypothetical protein